MTEHTTGPWEWADDGYDRVRLQTPDRGRLIVMDFARHGMQGARPRFAKMDDDQPRGRRGGILCATDPWLHPDGRLIAAAPELLAALKLAESVYRQNVVVTGEPSSVLDAMQAAIKKAEGLHG